MPTPEEEGIDAFAAKFAWRLQAGENETAIYLSYIDKYPLTPSSFFYTAQQRAREIARTTEALKALDPSEPILEAYDQPIPLDQPVGIRYAVLMGYRGTREEWSTYAYDVLPDTTRAELEERIRRDVQYDLATDPSSFALDYTPGFEAELVPMNALMGPLPSQI